MLLRYDDRMELRHLRYFVAVAEELNLTRAAARLRVAQPALSRQMHDLEDELQTPLLERGHTGVQLTRAGRALYPKARVLLAQAAEAANEARLAAGVISGRLVIGYPNGPHLNYLAPVIAEFRKVHPKVEFDFWHGLPTEQLRALRDLKIDLGFVTLPAPLTGLAHQIVWRVPIKVALPAKHPLAKQRAVELADLRGEDFVFFPRETRPELYDEFFRQCANAGFRPRIVKEVGGYPTNMLGLVSVGVGVCVLPYFKHVEHLAGMVWRPLTQPELSMDFALVWRKNAPSLLRTEFITLAERKLVGPAESPS
ncbi:MAG: LysR family transcriptional regulator [Verrucomicrobia subdivision 3 bacterium]|nr:LysR family transcriptional regulator [Limisphaerales bacterium]